MLWKLPELCKRSFQKSHAESIKLLNFGKSFQRRLFLQLEISNYQTLIKACRSVPFKRKSLAGLKKLSRETEKDPIFLYLGLRYADKKN